MTTKKPFPDRFCALISSFRSSWSQYHFLKQWSPLGSQRTIKIGNAFGPEYLVISKFLMSECACHLVFYQIYPLVAVSGHQRWRPSKSWARGFTRPFGCHNSYVHILYSAYGIFRGKTSLCLLHFLPLQIMSDSSCTDSFKMKPFKAEGTCVSSLPTSSFLIIKTLAACQTLSLE